jgi:hypothetical protein
MNIGDKIIIVNPKTIYIGVIVRDGLKADEIYACFYNFCGVRPFMLWVEKQKVMEKSEWIKYISQDEFDNLLLMACSTNPDSRALGKLLLNQTIPRK